MNSDSSFNYAYNRNVSFDTTSHNENWIRSFQLLRILFIVLLHFYFIFFFYQSPICHLTSKTFNRTAGIQFANLQIKSEADVWMH